jgi:pimeloyl-ACP methyl ester carboxylesterase/enoyl-CoA hydratase/carnithine racemase
MVTNGLLVNSQGDVLHIVLAGVDGTGEVDDAMLIDLTHAIVNPPVGTVAIVLSGAGVDFCRGRAPSSPPIVPASEDPRLVIKAQGAAPILALYDAIVNSEVPVACFVNGLASGLGCALVASCDYAVAAADSRFEATELDKQFAPALLMSALYDRLHVKAISRLVLTSRPIDAPTALELGLVGEIVPTDRLDFARSDFVALLNSRAPHALRGIKAYLRDAAGLPPSQRSRLAADVLAESFAARIERLPAIESPANMRYVDTGSERIAYTDVGSGPTLVLLHSLGTSTALWDDVLPELVSRYRVIAIDARGHGQSTNRGGIHADAIAQDVVAVVNFAGVDRFALLGISMGGLSAIRVAAKLGHRVAALMLSSAYASVAGPAAEKRLAMTEKMLQKLPMHVFARAYTEQTLVKHTPYARREKLARQIAMVSSETYIETLRTICRDDVSSMLTNVITPTAVFHAEYDASIPRTESERLTAGIRGAIEKTLQGVAHLACVDGPNIYVEAVLEFLDQHRNEDGSKWKS